LKKRWFSW